MKRIPSSLAASLLMLLTASGCGNMQSPFGSHAAAPAQPPQSTAAAPNYSNQTYAANTGDCTSLANQRMAMYDRPSTFPLSDKDKHDAYQALYTECVNGNTGQVAAASHNNVAANSVTAAEFANLSPAAGGYPPTAASTVNAGGSVVSTSSVPGATVVVIGGNKDTGSQLSSLSPSSGGNPSNATVVLVQSQNPPSAVPGAYYAAAPSYYAARPTAPLPVAVPVPPMAQGYSPAQPTQAMAAQPHAAYQPANPRQPSLAGADAAATGNVPSQIAGNQQLQTVLEK